MRKKINTLFMIVLIGMMGIMISSPSVKAEGEPYAEWIDTNGQQYLHVVADDYYTLGVLKGSNLAMQELTLRAVIEGVALAYGLDYATVRYFASGYDAYVPEDYRNEFQGIADGVNLAMQSLGMTPDFDYMDVLVQNAFVDIMYGQLLPMMAGEHMVIPDQELGCSAFGAMNRFLWFNSPMVAQNFDFDPNFVGTLAFVLSEINDVSVFALHFGACMLPTGENSHGVKVVVNALRTVVYCTPQDPTGVMARDAFEHSTSALEFENHITDSMSYNMIICDDNDLIGLQVSPIKIVREDVTTTVVRTNTFIDEELKMYLIDPTYSVERQAYLEQRMDEEYINRRWIALMLNQRVMDILADEPIICRSGDESSHTLAFYNSYGSFGIGNLANDPAGVVPI